MTLKLRIMFIVVFLFAPALAGWSPARAQSYAREDLLLFRDKCTQCHKMNKIFKPSSEVYEGDYAEIVGEMQEKAARKKGKQPISDAQKTIIIGLFESGTPASLEAALNRLDQLPDAGASARSAAQGADQPMKDAAGRANRDAGRQNDSRDVRDMSGEQTGPAAYDKEREPDNERVIELIESIHGPWQLAAFILLGLYMLFSGLSRKFKRKILVAFDFRKHAARGRIYVAAVLAGYAMGLAIWWFDGMDMGSAALHFQMGTATAALFAAGGVLGLQLASGRARNLKWLHMTCNLLASALFVFQIVTGLMMVLG